MKKLLLSLFVVLFAMGVKAQTEVVFDFDEAATALFKIDGRSSGSSTDGDITAPVTATLDGVSLTVSASGEGQTVNRLWNKNPTLRMYGGTLTISAPDHNITKIVFVSTASKFDVTADLGTLDGKTWTIDKAVSSVVFTVNSNTQLNSVTVTLDGQLGEEPEPVVIAGTGEGTVESPYDVERALSLIENDKVTSDMVYVAGKIESIEEVSTEYGNATYVIAQGDKTLKVYRGYYLGGEKFTAEDQIKVGDEVVVCGKLVTGYGGQITTGSSIYSLNGETYQEQPEEPYVPTGNGTKENPYTVEDIQKMNIEASDGEYYWVKGVILGCATSATKLAEGDKIADTNIALGMTAESSSFIPVQLPTKVDGLQAALGVATNPNNIGKEVLVHGTLEKYFSAPGVKNVDEYVLEGDPTQGIESIEANVVAKYYNLQGVEVANPANGNVYIKVVGSKATKVIK